MDEYDSARKLRLDQSEGYNPRFGRPGRPPNPIPKIAFKIAAVVAGVGLLAMIWSNRLDWVEPIVRIATGLPHFWEMPCDLEYDLKGRSSRCGYLFVEKNRSAADTDVTRIPVTIFETQYPDKLPDPVVHINGGPGYSSIFDSIIWAGELSELDRFRNRDLILFDQRGTGRSNSSFVCEDYWEYLLSRLQSASTILDEADFYRPTQLDACVERHIADGLSISSYGVAEIAADVTDLAEALGWESWNVLADSFGTMAAQYLAFERPKGIRSIILNGVVEYPTAREPHPFAAIVATLEKVFQQCRANVDCRNRHGNLKEKLAVVVDRLERSQFSGTIDLLLEDIRPSVRISVDHLAFSQFLVEALASEELLPFIPSVISGAANGDTSVIQKIVPIDFQLYLFPHLFNPFANRLVECMEGIEFSSNSADTAFSRYEGHPLFGWISHYHHKMKCPDFLTRVKRSSKTMKSSIPTLILSGEFDPKTPVDGAKSTVKKFQNGYLYVFPDRSHNAASHPCARKLIESFLENPTIQPNQTCMEQLQPIKFEPKV